MSEQFSDFFKNKKNIINLLILLILVLGLPLGVKLIREQQILKSRADVTGRVDFVEEAGILEKRGSIFVLTQQAQGKVKLTLTSPLGPPGAGNVTAATPTPTPASTASPTPTPASTASPLVGDINNDGYVDNADLEILSGDIDAGSSNARSDLNHDGTVDIFDYNLLIQNWRPR